MSKEQRATPDKRPVIMADPRVAPRPLTAEEQAYLEKLENKSKTFDKNMRFK